MTQEPTITFHVPEDPALLQGIAKVTICHAHLDYALRMCIKTLAGLTIEEALDATDLEGSRTLRDRIRKLARSRLGEGPALLKLQALMKRCGDLTAKRNEVTHLIIGISEDITRRAGREIALQRLPDHSWQSLPNAKELHKLADELTAATNELNHARLSGWLALALEQRPLP
jgi:hypothetical protein